MTIEVGLNQQSAEVAQVEQAPPAQPPTSTPQQDLSKSADSPKGQNMISMPTSALKNLKADERRKAERQLLAKLGVASVEELNEKLAAKPAPKKEKEPMTTQNSNPAPPAPAPAQPTDDRSKREMRMMKRLRELEEKNAQLAKKNAIAEKRARELRRQQDERSADQELRDIASAAGVKDVDYALFLLRREISGKSPAQLQAFDATAYFKGLSKTAPHIFANVVVPAGALESGQSPNAASDIKTPPSPPTPKDVANTGGDQPFNAVKASPEDYKARLKEKFGVTL